MRDRHVYLLAFFLPFGVVNLLWRSGMTWPGINTAGAILGTGVGLLVLVLTWLLSEGFSLPGRPDRWSVLLVLGSVLVVYGTALPVPAGAPPGQISNAERTCSCLGVAVAEEATPPFMDIDIRRYCYGIPHSCRSKAPAGQVREAMVRHACAAKAGQINDEYCNRFIRTAQYFDAGVANSSRGYAPPADYMNDSGDRWIEDQVCTAVRYGRRVVGEPNAGPVGPDGYGGHAYAQTAGEASCSWQQYNETDPLVTVDGNTYNCLNEGFFRSELCPVEMSD